MGTRKPRPRFVLLTSLAYRGVRAWLARQDGSMTLARAGALLLLGKKGAAFSVGDLAAELGLGLPGVSGLVDRMVDDGWVKKLRDPEDRRRWMLSLTPTGAKHCARAERGAQALNAALCEGFSERELAVVARWLEQAASVGAQKEMEG